MHMPVARSNAGDFSDEPSLGWKMQSLKKRLTLRSDRTISAIVVSAMGLLVLIASWDLSNGRIGSIGPGFFPHAVGGLLIFLSLSILLFGKDERASAESERVDVRSLFFVSAAVLTFMAANSVLGLFAAVFGAIFVSSLASRQIRTPQRLVMALVSAAICCLVFIGVLSLNFSVVKGVF